MINFDVKKNQIGTRIIFRALSTLNFVQEFLNHQHSRGDTDAAYSRPLYILTSFSCELILKSLLAFNSNAKDIEELNEELKGHDLKRIAKKINTEELTKIGIKSVERADNKNFVQYLVTTNENHQIKLEDFVDSRYDFMRDALREIEKGEFARILSDLMLLRQIATNVSMKYNPVFS